MLLLYVYFQTGEAGEFIGKIVKNDPVRDFHGYADKTASKKKVVRDVFTKGDSAFLSGQYFFFFPWTELFK